MMRGVLMFRCSTQNLRGLLFQALCYWLIPLIANWLKKGRISTNKTLSDSDPLHAVSTWATVGGLSEKNIINYDKTIVDLLETSTECSI